MPKTMIVLALASFVTVGHARSLVQTPQDRATIDDIRSKLLRLPYYGVFDFPAPSKAEPPTPVALMAAADEALYQAKREGGDRVVGRTS